jgi:hypothetical protein
MDVDPPKLVMTHHTWPGLSLVPHVRQGSIDHTGRCFDGLLQTRFSDENMLGVQIFGISPGRNGHIHSNHIDIIFTKNYSYLFDTNQSRAWVKASLVVFSSQSFAVVAFRYRLVGSCNFFEDVNN